MKTFSGVDTAVIETSANDYLSFAALSTLVITGDPKTGDSSDDGDKPDAYQQ